MPLLVLRYLVLAVFAGCGGAVLSTFVPPLTAQDQWFSVLVVVVGFAIYSHLHHRERSMAHASRERDFRG